METACSGIRQKTGRRPAIARVFLPQSGKIAANYKKPTIRQWDVPKQTGLFEAFPGVLPGLSGRRRWDGVRDGSRRGCRVNRPGKRKTSGLQGRTFRCILLIFSVSWRRGRDSNPRYSYPYTAFRVRPDRPLRHLSFSVAGGGLAPFSRPKTVVLGLQI